MLGMMNVSFLSATFLHSSVLCDRHLVIFHGHAYINACRSADKAVVGTALSK
jgi:hypothetical protein